MYPESVGRLNKLLSILFYIDLPLLNEIKFIAIYVHNKYCLDSFSPQPVS